MPRANRNEIYDSTIRRMVNLAIEEQEAQFAREHSGDSREQLLTVLRAEAARLGKSPWPREFPGGKTILAAFSSWQEALTQAGLPLPSHPDKISCFPRFQEETERQKAVFRQKKAEKKKKAQQRSQAQKQTRKEKKTGE